MSLALSPFSQARENSQGVWGWMGDKNAFNVLWTKNKRRHNQYDKWLKNNGCQLFGWFVPLFICLIFHPLASLHEWVPCWNVSCRRTWPITTHNVQNGPACLGLFVLAIDASDSTSLWDFSGQLVWSMHALHNLQITALSASCGNVNPKEICAFVDLIIYCWHRQEVSGTYLETIQFLDGSFSNKHMNIWCITIPWSLT